MVGVGAAAGRVPAAAKLCMRSTRFPYATVGGAAAKIIRRSYPSQAARRVPPRHRAQMCGRRESGGIELPWPTNGSSRDIFQYLHS